MLKLSSQNCDTRLSSSMPLQLLHPFNGLFQDNLDIFSLFTDALFELWIYTSVTTVKSPISVKSPTSFSQNSEMQCFFLTHWRLYWHTLSYMLTETSLLCHQLNYLCTVDILALAYLVQPFGTAFHIILETPHYLLTYLGAILKVTYLHITNFHVSCFNDISVYQS